MLILRGEEGFSERCALVLGGFDGLHLGHRVLLSRAKESGLPVGITTILGGKGKQLFTAEEREFLFSRCGLAFAIELPFTDALKNTPAETFLRGLFARLNVGLVVCGEDFRFGRNAEGTPETLKRIAGGPAEVVPSVKTDYMRAEKEGARARKISASACKAHLRRGELGLLNACLRTEDFYGSAYFIGGKVEHGREVGRTYGFPTLNLSVREEKLLPPDGVYRGTCATPLGNFPTVLNVGARPTFGVKERKIEAYLDGFSGDLYGAAVRVYPVEFLRPIAKFPSAEALRAQLLADIAALRKNMSEECK